MTWTKITDDRTSWPPAGVAVRVWVKGAEEAGLPIRALREHLENSTAPWMGDFWILADVNPHLTPPAQKPVGTLVPVRIAVAVNEHGRVVESCGLAPDEGPADVEWMQGIATGHNQTTKCAVTIIKAGVALYRPPVVAEVEGEIER